MKLLQMMALAGVIVTMTSCPRPYMPDFCDRPNPITVSAGCYNPADGLVLRSASLASADTSIKLVWTVYVMADTTANSQVRSVQIDHVSSGNTFTLSDFLLKDNRKIYVELETNCAGKAPGGTSKTFVKRTNKAGGCDQWGEQAL